jgi:hypothetical protein
MRSRCFAADERRAAAQQRLKGSMAEVPEATFVDDFWVPLRSGNNLLGKNELQN